MDKDKAIRSAKLTAAGILDKARARTAVTRAGGQIAPSKYLPNVPRAVHAGGGKVAFQEGNHPDVPDVVYHGTYRDFHSFDPEAKRTYDVAPHDQDNTDTGWFGKGHYFTPQPWRANHYAEETARRWNKEEGAQVYPVHLSLKNPFIVNMRDYDSGALTLDKALSALRVPMHPRGWRKPSEQTAALTAMGHDGVIAKREGKTEEIVAFKPEQIKSAIGNQGTFDPNDPDMTKAEGGTVGKEEGGATGSLREKGLWPSAQAIKAGTGSREAHAEMVNKIKPVSSYLAPVPPASDEQVYDALTKDKQPKAFAPRALEEGTPVAVRLDIPAYEKRNTWVVSVHHPKSDFTAGEVIGYDSVAHIGNPRFGVHPTGALNIASGKPKATIATVHGNWKKTTPEDAFKLSQTIHNDPQWRQVGMDPERHSYFYDRETQEPVMAADEALHIGPLVYAKNPVYGKKTDFSFSNGGDVSAAIALTRRFTKDGKAATVALKPKGK